MGASLVESSLYHRTVEHVVSAVEAAPLSDDPFPHVVVRGFFPTDVYAEILRLFPPEANYETFSYEKHLDTKGQSNRHVFYLMNSRLQNLPAEHRELWLAVRCALQSTALKDAIFAKLSAGLAYRYGCRPDAVPSLPGYALPEVFRETASYRIKPHPDTRRKVVTMQIALPEDNAQESLGTEFYRRSLRPGAWLREPVGFDIVKTMPFLPNTSYAFVVLNGVLLKSWHGRSTLGPMCGPRNSILNIWYDNVKATQREAA
jgi:hypothetical protein